jgi:pilus assembly protein Flp/PilA
MLKLLRRFKKGEEGATLAESGLLLALIAVVCLAAITTLGSKVSTMFSTVAAALREGGTEPGMPWGGGTVPSTLPGDPGAVQLNQENKLLGPELK